MKSARRDGCKCGGAPGQLRHGKERSSKGQTMQDLIFHLGLTKTASSFLQRRVFRGKMNTLENAIAWEDDRVEARAFQECFRYNSPFYWRRQGAGDLFFRDKGASGRNIVISHESLFEHVPFNDKEGPGNIVCEPYLVSARLKEIADNVWQNGGVKALFFFRKQSEWLPSIYAHVCYRLKEPSQADFDRRVHEFVSGHSSLAHAVDYSLLFEQLAATLGSESVLALPYEALHEAEIWAQLREFTGIDDLGEDVNLTKRDVNVKKLPGDKDWALSGRVQPLNRSQLVAPLRPLIRSVTSTEQRNKIKDAIKKVMGLEDLRIGIDDDLAAEVMKFYENGNRHLASMIRMDLQKYGYY